MEVNDASDVLPREPGPEPDHDGGRGLVILDALTERSRVATRVQRHSVAACRSHPSPYRIVCRPRSRHRTPRPRGSVDAANCVVRPSRGPCPWLLLTFAQRGVAARVSSCGGRLVTRRLSAKAKPGTGWSPVN